MDFTFTFSLSGLYGARQNRSYMKVGGFTPVVRNLYAKNAITMGRQCKVASGTVFGASYIVHVQHTS